MLVLNCKFDAADSLVRATLAGPFSLDEAKSTFNCIIDAIEQHGARFVLVDGREVTGAPSTWERYFYGEFVAGAVRDFNSRSDLPAPKFAYVLLYPVLDKDRLGETVALNRHMNLKVFDNLTDAEKWLGILPSPVVGELD